MTTLTADEAVAFLDADIEREERGEELAEEAARLAGNCREYVYAAWTHLGYPQPQSTFHIDAIAEHYQALMDRHITRLLVTIQPGAFKSTIVSVLGPSWQWARKPSERFLSFSHHARLSTRDTTASRTLMRGSWWLARWGHLFDWSEAENMKTEYSNTVGGKRVSGQVGGGTGDRGTVLQVDDPHNAKAARYVDTQLAEATKWWSDTAISRLDDTIDNPGAIVVIGQRVHQKDLIGHLIETGEGRWVHLCLPTRYEPKHPFVYPSRVKLRTGRVLKGDTRRKRGALLMPKLQDEEKLAERVAEDGVTAGIFAGQYQQLPSAQEGKILKRAGWRYYDRQLSFYRTHHDDNGGPHFDRDLVTHLTALGTLPRFSRIIESWDTSQKDMEHSDFVSGQAWGQPVDRPADRWLLRLMHGQWALSQTTSEMLVLASWTDLLWPRVPKFRVIERAANGPAAIAEITSQVQGVIAWPVKGAATMGDKAARARAASPALDGGNCYLPGYANATASDYDPRTPLDVQRFVEETAEFDTGAHDDQVDGWSQMVNYTREPFRSEAKLHRATGRKPRPRALPA